MTLKEIAETLACIQICPPKPLSFEGPEVADLLTWDEYRKTVFNSCRLVAEPFTHGNRIPLKTGLLVTETLPMMRTFYVQYPKKQE